MTAERPAPPIKKPSDEARLGASLAFGNNKKPIVKPKPGTGSKSGGDNEALAAALSSAAGAGRGRALDVKNTGGRGRGGGGRGGVRGSFDGALRGQNTGGSVASDAGNGGLGNMRPRMSQYGPGGPGAGYLQPSATDQSRSPSFIAATLAASRSASLSPNPTGGRTMRQPLSPAPVLSPIPADMRIPPRYASRSPSVRSVQSSRESEEMVLDTRSIPPTGSLIGMFEQNAAGAGKDAGSSKAVKRPKTPTPVRQIPARATVTPTRLRTPSPSLNKPKKAPPEPRSPKPNIIQAKGPAVPPTLTTNPTTPKRGIPAAAKERKASLPSSKPIPVPTKSSRVPLPEDDSSSGDSFVSASDYREASYEEHKPSWRAEIASQNRRRLTSASLHTLNSSVTVNSLADAIVASSLASSRAASPSKSLQGFSAASGLYPPLPPPRRTKHHNPAHLFHNGKNDISRTPSPGKASNGAPGVLRTTLRKVKSKEEVDEGEKRRGRKNIMKKHPNKHHEGDRKRWRDSITERERKRYEAVWASNRGLFTGSETGAENEVCSLVVRDVFSRSRLGEDVLEEVYALVDRRRLGTLGKEEFVVGLWLVDQRLKGRKLPIRVSESVWKSVGTLGGIKVRSIK